MKPFTPKFERMTDERAGNIKFYINIVLETNYGISHKINNTVVLSITSDNSVSNDVNMKV